MTGAFHSPMMASAVPEFARRSSRPTSGAPGAVISAVTAQPFEDLRLRLAEALTRPVRWRETMLGAAQPGPERFVETGPGRVLTGLAKRTLKDVELVNA